MPLPALKQKYTYQDYQTCPDDERWEIIDGIAYDMSPAPNLRHQAIVANFLFFLKLALKDKPCVPWVAPTDVVLSEIDVVQPDVFVVCDPKKMEGINIQGAPDLIIEILSPSNSLKERRAKKLLYEKSGVREYLLVEPEEQFVERFYLELNGKYSSGEIFDAQQILPLRSLEGLQISLWEIFGVEKKEQ